MSHYPSWPHFTSHEASLAHDVLLSNKVNYWTGTEGREFEREFAQMVGSNHAVAVANGTLALDLAFKALNISAGDEVIVTPRTFLASVSSIVNAGAAPVFADVDVVSQNITAETIAPVLSSKTKAIVCVHLAGWPCDMDAIRDLVDGRGIALVEDCAQAHGAVYKGQPVGSLGDVAAWSFCQDKIMTTGGEGGMLTTNDTDLWSAAWSFKDHGKSWDAVYNTEHPPGFRWLHNSFGTNWRLTEMQSAIGRWQVQQMPEWSEKRHHYATMFNTAFQDHEHLRLTIPEDDIRHAYYKYYVFVRPERLSKGWSRDRIMNEIVASGVPCFSGSCSEVYLEKAFDNTGWRPNERLPVAKELGETSLMFLVHPTLSTQHIEEMIAVADDVLKRAYLS